MVSFHSGIIHGKWVCSYPSSFILSKALWSAPRPEMKKICGFLEMMFDLEVKINR